MVSTDEVTTNPKGAGGSAKAGQLKKRILVVDDHPIFLEGISHLINHQPDLETCGSADSMPAALGAIETAKPDLLLTDISIKGNNGLELIKAAKARFPELPILVLSMHEESLFAERALRAGALGYVMKQEAAEHVLDAIQTALSGELYLSAAMGQALLRKFINGSSPADDSPLARLSDRELEVLQMIGQGMGSRNIAEELRLSIKTIESHRARIKEKLHLSTSPELVRFAVEWFGRDAT